MKKVYGMPGKVNAHIVITSPSGKTKYKIPFTGGSINDRNKTEAKFITDSPILQDVIERDARFNKSIFLLNSYGEKVQAAPAADAQAAPAAGKTTRIKPKTAAPKLDAPKQDEPKVKVMEDIVDMGAAISVLTGAGEVSASDVLDLEGVLKKAQEMGFSFPNLKDE